jgi:hypothetical protein
MKDTKELLDFEIYPNLVPDKQAENNVNIVNSKRCKCYSIRQ